jgi:hypothetical protein
MLTALYLSATIMPVNQDMGKEAQIMADHQSYCIAGLRLWVTR